MLSGINHVADLECNQGLCEAARGTRDAIRTTNIPYHVIPYSLHGSSPVSETLYHPHPITLMHYNINVMQRLSPRQFQHLTGDKYTIAAWFWELPTLSDMGQLQIERVDEIWVAAHYVQNIFKQYTRKPVSLIPLPIALQLPENYSRADYRIPENRYTFLFTFSAASSMARKNPWGVIEAFKRAFGRMGAQNSDAPLLVIKTNSLDLFPIGRDKLRTLMREIGGILIEEDYTREQVNGLTACCDAYVSLHRSEGFGLTLAEAMYLGKPVIGTHYSANVDFMNYRNSYPVRFYLRPIEAEDHKEQPGYESLYQPGQMWAEPDIDQTAQYMRYLYENQDAGRQQGQRAREFVRSNLSPEAVGRVITARMKQINLDHPRINPNSRTLKSSTAPATRKQHFMLKSELPGYGWYPIEHVQKRSGTYPIQWMSDKTATVYVKNFDVSRPVSIEFAVDKSVYPGGRLPTIQLHAQNAVVPLNEKSDGDYQVFSGTIPAVRTGHGTPLELHLDVSNTFVPSELIAGNQDHRELGVAVCWLKLESR